MIFNIIDVVPNRDHIFFLINCMLNNLKNNLKKLTVSEIFVIFAIEMKDM